MTYYLVSGNVRVSYYMSDSHTEKDLRLVKANSPEEAKEKYDRYWADKSSEYSVSYYVSGHVEETVE